MFTTCNPVNTKYLWADMERVNLSHSGTDEFREYVEEVDSSVHLLFFLFYFFTG